MRAAHARGGAEVDSIGDAADHPGE